jgi:very-short-patch-repair endonuclease
MARKRRLPADALFSHRTAAWLHGLDLPPCDPIEITLPQLSRISHLSGVSLTRSDYFETEACEVTGLPATSRTRTIADLARRLSLAEGVVVIDMSLRSRLVELGDIGGWITAHPRHRGIRRLRRATALADAGSESPMETRLRVLLVTDGLPKPCVQFPLHSDTGVFLARPDLFYPDQRLIVEYDGATHRDSVAADNRRHNRLTDAGYRVLRFTAGDILHRPATVTGLVRRALAYSIGSPN